MINEFIMIDPITGRSAGAKGGFGGGGRPPNLNDFPPAGEAGGKNPKFPEITTVTTTTAGL